MLQANGGQENIELRGIPILLYLIDVAPIFSNLCTSRTDSDPAHAVELKFLYPEERWFYTYPFYFTAKTFEDHGCLFLLESGYRKS